MTNPIPVHDLKTAFSATDTSPGSILLIKDYWNPSAKDAEKVELAIVMRVAFLKENNEFFPGLLALRSAQRGARRSADNVSCLDVSSLYEIAVSGDYFEPAKRFISLNVYSHKSGVLFLYFPITANFEVMICLQDNGDKEMGFSYVPEHESSYLDLGPIDLQERPVHALGAK